MVFGAIKKEIREASEVTSFFLFHFLKLRRIL